MRRLTFSIAVVQAVACAQPADVHVSPEGPSVEPEGPANEGEPSSASPGSLSARPALEGVSDLSTRHLALFPARLATASAFEPYQQPITLLGEARGPCTWTLQGDLPDGLALVESSGPRTEIVGMPTAVGRWAFSISVADGPRWTRTDYVIDVDGTEVRIDAEGVTVGKVGTPFEFALSAVEGQGPFFWRATGLPAGLMVQQTNGRVSRIFGRPKDAGIYDVEVHLQARDGYRVTRQIRLEIEPPLALVPGPGGQELTLLDCETGSFTAEVRGGLPPFTWTVVHGRHLVYVRSHNGRTGFIEAPPRSERPNRMARIQVRDARGETAEMTVRVHPRALRIFGGEDREVATGNLIVLRGELSDPIANLQYSWSIVSAPANDGRLPGEWFSSVLQPLFMPRVEGTYRLRLTATLDGFVCGSDEPVLESSFPCEHQVDGGPDHMGAPIAFPTLLSATASSGRFEGVTWTMAEVDAPGSSWRVGDVIGNDRNQAFMPDVGGRYRITVTSQYYSCRSTDEIVVETENQTCLLAPSMTFTPATHLGEPIVVESAHTEAQGPDCGQVTRQWSLNSVPARSALVPGPIGTTSTVAFTPDVPGAYTVALRVDSEINSAEEIRTYHAACPLDVQVRSRVFAAPNATIIPQVTGANGPVQYEWTVLSSGASLPVGWTSTQDRLWYTCLRLPGEVVRIRLRVRDQRQCEVIRELSIDCCS